MKVLIDGPAERVKTLQSLIPSDADCMTVPTEALSSEVNHFQPDVVLMTDLDDHPQRLKLLQSFKGVVVGCAVKRPLYEMAATYDGALPFTLVGMNMWPFFASRESREMSRLSDDTVPAFIEAWGWKVRWVADRVGMVTPRILVMIINEAYYTVQEGTASKEAINTAMRLGTNYPGGPFEWVAAIGVKEVYELLVRLWEDTRDPRYRPAPLLKTEAYRNGMGE